MRSLAIALVFIMSAAASYCQTGGPKEPPLVSPDEMVRRIIELGIYEGQMEMSISRMGDAAAVAVTKVLVGKNPSALEIDMVLVVFSHSFAGIKQVENISDRQPRTALFVLRYLDTCTQDLELKKRIAYIRKYIQDEYTKSLQ